MLSLDGTSLSGYASFYSTESSTGTNPYFSIEVTDNYLGATLYGDAPVYLEGEYPNANCLGYALCLSYGIDIYIKNTPKIDEFVINAVINTIKDHGFDIKEIDSYDSDILNDERRIAFRYNPHQDETWHFIRQNSDGSWSGKAGTDGVATQFLNSTPENDEQWWPYSGVNYYLYNIPTFYFAIKEV